jgi:hypothetical protein
MKYRGYQTRIIELGLMKYEKVILPLEEQDSPARPGKILPFPGGKKPINNDLTVAMDTAQELMGGGIPFWDAVFQGLDESGTATRWKREKEDRKKGRGKKHETIPYGRGQNIHETKGE